MNDVLRVLLTFIDSRDGGKQSRVHEPDDRVADDARYRRTNEGLPRRFQRGCTARVAQVFR